MKDRILIAVLIIVVMLLVLLVIYVLWATNGQPIRLMPGAGGLGSGF